MSFTVYPTAQSAQGSIDTYLISGGLSQCDKSGLIINRVESSTFRINTVDLSYGGGTDIVVPADAEDYKIYLYNNGGVGALGIDEEAPSDSIIIASFDSDATRIVDYRLSGNFAVTTELNKIVEHVNQVVEGDFTKVVNPDSTVTITWVNPLRVYLLSKSAGSGIVNTVAAGSVTLNQGNVAFISLDRSNNVVRPLQTSFKTTVDLSADDQYLFYYSDTGVFSSSISPLKRVDNLEEIENEIEIYEVITTATGSVTVPEKAEIQTGRFRDGANATLTTLESSRPTGISPKTGLGEPVSVTLNTDGSYTLSDAPSSFPIGIVYSITVINKHLHTIPKETLYKVYNSSSDVSFTSADPTAITVGGIPAGTVLTNTTYEDLVDLLLFPELFGSLTNPSLSFSSSETGLREVGSVIDISFSCSLNKGSIDPQYESDSPFRAGSPTYTLTGGGTIGTPSAVSPYSETVTGYEVTLGTNTWSCEASYLEGVQPKGSKSTPFNSPLPAGSITRTKTITGVYPVYASENDLLVPAKQGLQSHGTDIEVDLTSEDGSNKQFVEVPQVWGSLNSLQQLNTLSGNWDDIAVGSFTTSTITKEINGNTINYTKYTHNGGTIGNRTIKLKF